MRSRWLASMMISAVSSGSSRRVRSDATWGFCRNRLPLQKAPCERTLLASVNAGLSVSGPAFGDGANAAPHQFTPRRVRRCKPACLAHGNLDRLHRLEHGCVVFSPMVKGPDVLADRRVQSLLRNTPSGEYLSCIGFGCELMCPPAEQPRDGFGDCQPGCSIRSPHLPTRPTNCGISTSAPC